MTSMSKCMIQASETEINARRKPKDVDVRVHLKRTHSSLFWFHQIKSNVNQQRETGPPFNSCQKPQRKALNPRLLVSVTRGQTIKGIVAV